MRYDTMSNVTKRMFWFENKNRPWNARNREEKREQNEWQKTKTHSKLKQRQIAFAY